MNIELFSCGGGMAEGFRRAGISFDCVYDWSPDACATYEANIGARPVCMDIRDLLRMVQAGWSAGTVNLVVADPPCTPWSPAGKRLGLADERDMLLTTCNLIGRLNPRAFLIGNLPGLQHSSNAGAVQLTIGRIDGYCLHEFTLDAADYGVPQRRIRPFWYGHRVGRCISVPPPTHCAPHNANEPHLPGIERLLPWVTCADALGHLTKDEIGREVNVTAASFVNSGISPSIAEEPAKTLTCNTHSRGALLINRKHQPSQLNKPSRTVRARDGGGAQGANSLLIARWPWDRPSTTVCAAGERIAPPGHHNGSYMSRPSITKTESGAHQRVFVAVKLSERAGTILQGFPETWRWISQTKRGRWSMIGQAMPPSLAEAVARQILKVL
jgi:DNA (cytosine-5)-methyltransferase 1